LPDAKNALFPALRRHIIGPDEMRNLSVWLLVAWCALGISQGHAQEREWILDAETDDVFLAFGVPNTDDIAISLWCSKGTDQPKFFAATPFLQSSVKSPTAHIEVGSQSFDFALNAQAGPKTTVETQKILPGEFLQALQNQDHVTVTIAQHKSVFPLDGADVKTFLKLCASKS
jgi:hypothetical protein